MKLIGILLIAFAQTLAGYPIWNHHTNTFLVANFAILMALSLIWVILWSKITRFAK